MALILASGSPRRRELLTKITGDFTVCPGTLDESTITAPTPALLAQALAIAKCREASAAHTADTVLGCDTVVEADGQVFGKPKDKADAHRMLSALSGRTHLVHTGVCVRHAGQEQALVETTAVTFGPIPDAELAAYLQTAEPYDKAGAYAIQGRAAVWCSRIEGCYYNIMGLPVYRTAALLRPFIG